MTETHVLGPKKIQKIYIENQSGATTQEVRSGLTINKTKNIFDEK